MNPIGTLQRLALATLGAISLLAPPVRASIAYGSINNFDTVNDTGHECHGFEIEIEDCHSTDITYTYDYNHYGTSHITQDDSIPGHPKCLIRWESKKNPDGSWASYTAIPSGPVNPTDGHMFTNPSVNFGGEHFGVGYYAAVGAVRYRWLIDDGAGNLVSGGAVDVSTPTFTYYPPIPGVQAFGQVQAEIQPPEAQEIEVEAFGKAIWMKEIRTVSHNNGKVRLRDLVSDDPDREGEKNWKNGEADEVETEWQLLQKENGAFDGGQKGKKVAEAEDLPGGDEVVTRRYEFYKYKGPLDAVSGEALGENVGPDGIHGDGLAIVNGVEVDLSTLEVVGDYTGAQMAAVDVEAAVALIDHVSEGRVNTDYVARTLVIPGAFPFESVMEGALPAGMVFDETTGILSGTPTESGEFHFSITASDLINPDVSKNYVLLVAAEGEELPPTSLVDTMVLPQGTGSTAGDGAFAPGSPVTVIATAEPGYRFANWTDNGAVVGTDASYTFVIDVNHTLVADFTVDVPRWSIATESLPANAGTTSGGGLLDEGSQAVVTASPAAGFRFSKWTENGVEVSTSASYSFSVTAARTLVANFTVIPSFSITTGVTPANSGTTSGGGSYLSGTNATVVATATPGFVFAKWTSGSTQVSTSPGYTFTVTATKNLVANFIAAGIPRTITASASPAAWGAVSGGGNFVTGDSATLMATPQPGHAFSRWREGNTTVSTSAEYTFTVTASRTLVAEFIEAFVITTQVSPVAGGSAEMDSATYQTNEKARAVAIEADGYTFTHWTEDGVVVSTERTYGFKATGSRTLVANFVADTGCTITINSSPSHGGSATGDDLYFENDDVLVSAVPNPGYGFVCWTQDGAVISTDAAFAFTADFSRALVANFAPLVSISATATPPEGGGVTGGGEQAAGTAASLQATANPGYAFLGWTEGAAAVDAPASYDFTVSAARTLVANFVQIPRMETAAGAPGSNSMVITWPLANTGWQLQESMDCLHWTASGKAVITEAGSNKVTIPTTGGAAFFRLAHP